MALKKNRWIILLNIVFVTFLCCLDSSSVNVALPLMAEELAVSMASIEWVITANLLTIICFILIFGSMGDMIGQDKVFKFGIVVFVIGALICAMASSFPLLIIGRIVEGFGASATMATNQGLIAQTFPANERGRALGISGSFVAMGSMFGPAFGGLILGKFSWNMIFLLNVPIGLLALVLAMKILPRTQNDGQKRLDIKGSLLFMFFVSSLYLGVKLLQQGMDKYWEGLLIFGVAFIMGFIFVKVERHEKRPMLELSLFKNKLFTISVLCSFLSFFAISSNNFIQPFYLQKVLEISPTITGMIMMTYPIVMFMVAPLSGYLSDKIGSEILGFIGLSISSSGLMVMSFVGENTPLGVFLGGVAMIAFGTSLFQSPNTSLIISTVPKNKLGTAGSINGLVRNLGMVFGISVSTLLLYGMMSQKMGYRVLGFIEGRPDVYLYGMQYVYRFAAIICFVGVFLTGLRWLNKRHKTPIR